VFKVASQAGIIHSQNQGFQPRSRPAGDAQQPPSPFSDLLDNASEAPPPPPKDACERSQRDPTSRPSAAADSRQQPPQGPADSAPAQPAAAAASAQPVNDAEKIDKAAVETFAAATLDDDQTDPAKASGDSAVTTVTALANAVQPTPEQGLPAAAIAAATPFEAPPLPEQTAAAPVTAPTTPSKQQPAAGESDAAAAAPATPLETPTAPGQAAPVVAAPDRSSEGQSAPEQPIGALAPTVSETPPASERPRSAVADATTIPAQVPAEAAEVPDTGPDTPALTSVAGPRPASPAKLTAGQNNKTAAADPNGSPIDESQAAGATQTNGAEAAKGTPAANAGPAANEEHPDGHADGKPEDKKHQAPVTAVASRAGLQNSEPLSTPHAAGHEIASAGKAPDDVQLLNMQQPADRLATGASAATQSASAQDAAVAAVPLAGLGVEIAARALAGRNRFEIRLDPPELGRVDVRLDIDRSGQVTSRLMVERVETLDALRRDAADLERALQQAGFKTADNGLQFALRDHAFAGRDQTLPAPAPARIPAPAPELPAIDAMPAGYGRILRAGGGIDIRV
jgi:flagellar hook-length control protein FliK